MLPHFHTGMPVHTPSSWNKCTKGESYKGAWGSWQSSILFRTDKKQAWVLKLVVYWRQWFQECSRSLAGGFLCCVSSQPKPSSIVALCFSYCLSAWPEKHLSVKHPGMFCNSVSELLPLVYYFTGLALYNSLIFVFLMYCYLPF